MSRKNIFAFLLSFCFLSTVFSQQNDCPELLKGIWENSDRKINFEKAPAEFILQPFYTLYEDYAAGNPEKTLDRNDATSPVPQKITVEFIDLMKEFEDELNGINKVHSAEENNTENNQTESRSVHYTFSPAETESGVYLLKIKYDGNRDFFYIPAAVNGNELYLDFKIKYLNAEELMNQSEASEKVPENSSEKEKLKGYWLAYGNASEILIVPSVIKKSLESFYVTDDSVYFIRYWFSEMDYENEAQAYFSDNEKVFSVKKHIFTGNKNYTCVNGKGTRIRNVEKSENLPEQYKLNSVYVNFTDESGNAGQVKASNVCFIGKPYLIRKQK